MASGLFHHHTIYLWLEVINAVQWTLWYLERTIFISFCVVEVDWPSIYQYNSMHYTMLSICDCYCNCTMGLGKEIIVGLARATFFMVRVGFRACSFGTGWAQFTGNLHRLISGRNISNLGRIWAAFRPHLGHYYIWIIVTRHKKCYSNYSLLKI